jgi:hypothetical protein
MRCGGRQLLKRSAAHARIAVTHAGALPAAPQPTFARLGGMLSTDDSADDEEPSSRMSL